MIKIIGFDLDNTLYDQKKFEFESFQIIAKMVSINFNIDEIEYFNNLKNLYLNGENEYLFDKAFVKSNGSQKSNWENFVIKKILPSYRNFCPKKLKLFSGTRDKIIKLKNNNLKLVLITNGNKNVQNNKIEALKIRKYFDLILISDEFSPRRRKPDSFMFSKALNFFSVNASEMAYIGDDLIRDKACEKLGIKFIHYKDPTDIDPEKFYA